MAEAIRTNAAECDSWIVRVLGVELPKPAPRGAPQDGGPGRTAPPGIGAVAFGKLRLQWDATKKSVAGDIAKLKSSATRAFDSDPLRGDLDALDDVIAHFNEGLGDRLDDIANAADKTTRNKAAEAATAIANAYVAYVGSDPLIGLIEINPIEPIAVAAPLVASLTNIRTALATLDA